MHYIKENVDKLAEHCNFALDKQLSASFYLEYAQWTPKNHSYIF